MGFNPFRKQEKTLVDVLMVVLALAATVGLVIWAVLPR
jgi:hypothetical protein